MSPLLDWCARGRPDLRGGSTSAYVNNRRPGLEQQGKIKSITYPKGRSTLRTPERRILLPKPETVRMSDVAKLAGVSTMTVSRSLRGTFNVTDDLRSRVLAAVAKLNYHPNEVARSLREQRSRQIGIIVPYLFDPFFAICAHAMSEVAKEHSYSVILSTSNEDPEAEYKEACRMLRRNVEGLLLIPASNAMHGPSLLLRAEFASVPVAVADRPVESGTFDNVLVDNAPGAQRGTEHLIWLGHKRITFVGFKRPLYTLKARQRGYETAIRAAGLKPSTANISDVLDDAITLVRWLVNRPHPPTALFCGNNLITRHVLHGLRSLGMSPPHPIALVGFDDFATADLLQPGVSVIRQPVEQLGRTAAEMLFARLNAHGPVAPVNLSLPVELIVRGSCGAMRPGAEARGSAHADGSRA